MARVCKAWREGFHDPCLWSNKTMLFCHRKDEKDLKATKEFYYTSGRNGIKLVKQFPRYLKKVTILFMPDLWRRPKDIINDLQNFAELLDDANIKEINLINLKLQMLKGQMRSNLLNA
ncbi:unnamed protein product, partial [Lymnaea stagnalis]